MNGPQIPQTDSIQQLAQFWDTHDLTDFQDELEEITEPVFERRAMLKIPLQAEEMEALKEKFALRADELREPISEANRELAAALVEDRSYSQRVKDAVDRIHRAQAELQKATVEHLVEMRTVLNDDQFNEFLMATTTELREH